MNNRRVLYLIPATAMVIIVMAAVSMFYRNAQAGDTQAEISKEEARKIVLYDAGAKAEDVTFTKEKLDMEAGILTYEMDFYTGEKSYEYELNAQTGSIREKEVTSRRKTTTTEKKADQSKKIVETRQTGTDKVIGVEKAQEIVLKEAGLKASQVTFSQCNLDTEDGVMVYEIEFRHDGKEYDYGVDALTGKIVESDIDVIEVKTNLKENKSADVDDNDSDDRYDDDDHDDDDDDDDDD